MKRLRPTLALVLLTGVLGVLVLVGVLFLVFVGASRRSIAKASDQLRESAAERVESRVREELDVAERVLDDVERRIRLGVVSASDESALARSFFTEVVDNPHVEEVALTRATLLGHDEKGKPNVAADGRWQLSVSRATAGENSPIRTRKVARVGAEYVADAQERAFNAMYDEARAIAHHTVNDPTENETFTTTASRDFFGQVIWSDLHPTQNDEDLPRDKRRVVVTAIKAIEDHRGQFVGVLRVGILAQVLDEIARFRVDEGDPADPHRVFLCDDKGRFVTRLSPDDPAQLFEDDDLRIVPRNAPREVDVARTLVQQPTPARFDVDGRSYVVTFRHIDGTFWDVGIVVPEDWYARDLRGLQRSFLIAYGIVTVLIVLSAVVMLRALRRGLGEIVQSTSRIRQLDFRANDSNIAFSDVQAVMDSLERAKTVMRALEKYVPVDLVRQLFQANRDPVLGGELLTISMMFTDIEGFTSLSEVLSPNELARALGRYLETMAAAIARTDGTIDKFIGDAVMAIWNAPTPCEDHAKKACEAALSCIEATAKLYASDEWKGLAPMFTRFGLHKDNVLVGHFGAPARMSFTALGDGVNLAARLEPLCKQYGIAVMASETIEAEARDAFVFRALDVVAVKGKKKGIKVFELLGRAGDVIATLDAARAYEEAFAAYLRRDFAQALAQLERHPEDPPSRVLRDRCRALIEHAPPADWDGVYVAATK